jgi:hypothetical protein
MHLWRVVKRDAGRRPRFHHLDRPSVRVWHQPQAYVHHAQEILGEDAARGLRGGHGLRDEEPRSSLGVIGQRLEHSLEEESRLLSGNILIEESGQRLQEDHQPNGVRGEQGVEAVAEQRGQLPAGEGAHEMDPTQEDLWCHPAGFGHGDDRRHLKGHTGIHQRHLQPLGQRTCGVRRAT